MYAFCKFSCNTILLSRYKFLTHLSSSTDSAFKQQRLPAWQPILTAGTVLPTFFVIGIAFIPVGVGLLWFSDEVKEIVVDYTYCNRSILQSDGSYVQTGTTCSDVIKQNSSEECICKIDFTLDADFKVSFFVLVHNDVWLYLFWQGKVYMYYGLSNYYQNHRRYVKSRDDNQLLGRLSNTPSSDCQPFAFVFNATTQKDEPIAPCGAIANSLFSGKKCNCFNYCASNLIFYQITSQFGHLPMEQPGKRCLCFELESLGIPIRTSNSAIRTAIWGKRSKVSRNLRLGRSTCTNWTKKIPTITASRMKIWSYGCERPLYRRLGSCIGGSIIHKLVSLMDCGMEITSCWFIIVSKYYFFDIFKVILWHSWEGFAIFEIILWHFWIDFVRFLDDFDIFEKIVYIFEMILMFFKWFYVHLKWLQYVWSDFDILKCFWQFSNHFVTLMRLFCHFWNYFGILEIIFTFLNWFCYIFKWFRQFKLFYDILENVLTFGKWFYAFSLWFWHY